MSDTRKYRQRAKRELERRAALLALNDEPVGASSTLALLRDALDRYVDASRQLIGAENSMRLWETLRNRVGIEGPTPLIGKTFYLNHYRQTAIMQLPIFDRLSSQNFDVPTGTLKLYAYARDPRMALRVIQRIERKIREVEQLAHAARLRPA